MTATETEPARDTRRGPTSLSATFELPGSVSYHGFTEFTFPEAYLSSLFVPGSEGNVLHARLSNGRELLGVVSPRKRGDRACAWFFGRMEPGTFDANIIGLDIKADPHAMRLLPAIADDPRDYFATITCDKFALTFERAWVEVLEHTAAIQKFKFSRATVETHGKKFRVNAEMAVTIGSHAPYFEYEGYVCLSDIEKTPDFLDVNGLVVDFPEIEKVTEQPAEFLRMWSGAKIPFRGRVLAQPKAPPAPEPEPPQPEHPECSDCTHLADIDDDAPNGASGERAETAGQIVVNWHPGIAGRPWLKLKPEHWNGHVGPHKGVMGGDWPLSSAWSSDPYGASDGGVHMRANPPGTGDAAAFCKHHMDSFFVPPAFHEALINGLDFEAQRQTAHFEPDGRRWIRANHPDAVFYGSLPDYRLGSDTLSFAGGTWVKQGEIKAQDDAHIEMGRVIDAIYNTDSELAFWIFEDQLKAVLHSQAGRRGQTRSVGRMLDVLAYGFLFFEEYADECRSFSIEKARAWFGTLPAGDPQAMQFFPGTIDRHPRGYARYLEDYAAAAEGFQNALALEGFDSWMALDPTWADAVNPGFRAAALRVSESIVDEFIERNAFGPGYQYWYTIGWNEDGAKVGAKIHGKNAWDSSSDHDFMIQGFAAIAMCYRDTQNDALRDKAREVIVDLGPASWNDARYLGNYRELVERARAELAAA